MATLSPMDQNDYTYPAPTPRQFSWTFIIVWNLATLVVLVIVIYSMKGFVRASQQHVVALSEAEADFRRILTELRMNELAEEESIRRHNEERIGRETRAAREAEEARARKETDPLLQRDSANGDRD